MAPLVTMSRLLRLRSYYTVPQAGAQIGLGRTCSYDAAEAGLIPIERAGAGGKLMLVPRDKWDRQVKRLLLRAAKPPRSTAPLAISVTLRNKPPSPRKRSVPRRAHIASGAERGLRSS